MLETPMITETPIRVTEFRRFNRVFFSRWIVTSGLVMILILTIIAIFAPLLSPYNPYSTSLEETLQPPSLHHLLGTDTLGRDTLTRIMYGARTSLMIGVVVVFCSSVIGFLLGLVAAYYGGWLSTIIMRIMDALMAFPMVLLALMIASLLGGGILNVIIALTVALVPVSARLMCGQVISAKENDYIIAERSLGASHSLVMFRHLLPNCFPPLIVMVTMVMGEVILAEAGLSFLGLGVSPPTAAWGSMISDGRNYLLRAPILSFAPGFALMMAVYGFTMVGDGLRDALDPRLRGVL